MGQLKLSFYRRTCILVFVFCDVHLLGFAYEPMPRTSTGTDSPPYTDLLTSLIDADVCRPIKTCPDTHTSKETRKMCFPSPPPGHIYHCGYDPVEEKFVDFFYPPFWCPEGISSSFG